MSDRMAVLTARRSWPNTYTAPEAKAWIAAMDAAEAVLYEAGVVDEFGYFVAEPPSDLAAPLREAAQKVVTEYDKTHLTHDVAYEDVADAIDALRAALATPQLVTCHWPHPNIPDLIMRSSECHHG